MSQIIAQKNSEIILVQSLLGVDGLTPQTGLAGTVGLTLRDEVGLASEVVTVTEQGTSGFYNFKFTPLNGRGSGYSYFLQITEPSGTSGEGIYGFEIRVFDSVQFAGTSGSFLTTLANVKEFLGIPTAETAHDTLLTNLIARVTDKAERRANRKFISATFTEIQDGFDDPGIYVKNPPIASVTSLHVSSDQTWDATTQVLAADFLFDKEDNGGMVRRKASVDFPEGFQNVRVIYVGGFATIPAALEDAAIKIVAWWFTNRKRLGITTTSLRETSSSALPLPENDDSFDRVFLEFQLPAVA